MCRKFSPNPCLLEQELVLPVVPRSADGFAGVVKPTLRPQHFRVDQQTGAYALQKVGLRGLQLL